MVEYNIGDLVRLILTNELGMIIKITKHVEFNTEITEHIPYKLYGIRVKDYSIQNMLACEFEKADNIRKEYISE